MAKEFDEEMKWLTNSSSDRFNRTDSWTKKVLELTTFKEAKNNRLEKFLMNKGKDSDEFIDISTTVSDLKLLKIYLSA